MKLKQTRKNYSAEEKVALLRRHLEKGKPVSKLCEEHTLRPTVFYRWKKEFFEGARRRLTATLPAKPRNCSSNYARWNWKSNARTGSSPR